MRTDRLTGSDRCWPCTVANTVVGLIVAWVPLVAMVLGGQSSAIPVAGAWGTLVTCYTVYRLYARGHLPYAGSAAKATGIHDVVGPGTRTTPRGTEGGTDDDIDGSGHDGTHRSRTDRDPGSDDDGRNADREPR